ncbi:MAG: glycosyltransferase family 2 protein, partial [Candidatus Bathyarchaeales archaeon]
SVIIPAYNEEKTIGYIIAETISVMDSLKLPYEVIIVDDGSTDNTRKIVTQYKATVLSNGINCGKGYALRKGFQQARGDIIITMDSDGTHSPKEIPSIIYPLLNGVDIVTGSRFKGRGKESTSKLHLLGNFIFNVLIMILTKKRVTDSQTGFRGFKKEFLHEINLESYGYEIETEMTVKGLKNGFVFHEIPISCVKRKYSTSKLKILSDSAKIFKAILRATFIKSMVRDGNRN